MVLNKVLHSVAAVAALTLAAAVAGPVPVSALPLPVFTGLVLHPGIPAELTGEDFTYGVDPPAAPASLLWFQLRLQPATKAGSIEIGPCARGSERITVAFAKDTDVWERLLLPNEPLCATSTTEVTVEEMDSGATGSVSTTTGTWRAAATLVDTAHGVGAKRSRTSAKRVISATTPSLGLTAFQVTATSPGGSGKIYAWPCGTKRPSQAAMVVRNRGATTNVVFLAPSVSSTVCFQASVSAYLEIQVLASFGAGAAAGVAPIRLVDSHAGVGVAKGKVTPGSIFSVPLPVPLQSASFVVVSVTSTWSRGVGGGVSPGHCGENYFHFDWGILIETRTGASLSEQWIVPVSPSGTICFGSQYGENHRAVYDVTVDVVGTVGSSYTPKYGYTT